VTFAGQVFTIIYAMLGTPLLLIFLANIGNGMARTFTYVYSRWCCCWCRVSRYANEALPGKRKKRITEDDIGKEDYMPTEQVQVPISITLVIISLTLVFGAIIFSNWEGWSLHSSCYFCFITLSTIGFGDMVPGNSFLDGEGNSQAFKMGFTVAYSLFGMALISMCIQMMQEQILTKVRWSAQELGLMKRPTDEKRVVYKRSGKVMETAEGQDGDRQAEEKRRAKEQKREERRERRKERERQESATQERSQQESAAQESRGDQEPLVGAGGGRKAARDDPEEDLFNLA